MSLLLTTATLFACCTAVPQDPTPPPAAQAKPAAQDQAPAKLDPKVYDHFGTGILAGEAPASVLAAQKDPA